MKTSDEKSLSRKKKCVGAWMMALLALSPAALSAAESVTPFVGGAGGNVYTIGCGNNAMVGVRGGVAPVLASSVVGFIQPICVGLNADGSWNGTPAPAPGIAGVNRGNSVSLQCPQTHAVSGIYGLAGIYVDQLGIYCAHLVELGHLNGEGSSVGHISDPPPPRDSFGPLFCTSDKPGKGFAGKAGDWIDRLALVCDYPVVAAPVVKTLSLASTSVVGGTTVPGTVTLNANVVAFEASVNLSMSVPSSATFQSNPITVPRGTRTANFAVNTNPVSRNVTNSISASPNTGSLTAFVLMIFEPSIQSLNLSTTKTSPGGSVTGTVSLNGKVAAPGGVTVNLVSSDTAVATVPSTVSIPQDQISATFPVTVSSANQSGCAVIMGTNPFGYYNQGQFATVLAVQISPNPAFTLSLLPTSGSSVTGTVRFPNSSPAARTLSLFTSNLAATSVPASVTVPAGALSADFTITISLPGPNCAVITAIHTTDFRKDHNSVILNMAGRSVSVIN